MIQHYFSEFEFTYVRSSGPGGQNVNKVNSKCVLRWNVFESTRLTGPLRERFLVKYSNQFSKSGDLIISSDRYRDQKRNFDDCLLKLNTMLLSVARPPKVRRKTKPTRSSQKRAQAAKKSHSEKKSMRQKPSF